MCNHQSESLGNHFHHSDHGYPDISQYRWEILVGHLMGDASYHGNNKYGLIQWNMTNFDYMKWLKRELGWVCNEPTLHLTKEEQAKNNFLLKPEDNFVDRDHGMLSGDPDNYKDQYRSQTICHPLIDRLDWIKDGKKVFPDTLRLTPTMVKVWFCDDGGLSWGSKSPNAKITATSQIDRLGALSDKFEDVVCRPKVSSHGSLRFNKDETEELLEWMGEAPPGMEYKFCLESRKRYHELKP